MGTPQKGYGDYKNRSGGVGWDTDSDFQKISNPLKDTGRLTSYVEHCTKNLHGTQNH
jgi:hypothetical protein